MTTLGDLTPEQQELVFETGDAMRMHKGAHALWGEMPADTNPWTDCPVCGLKWAEQYVATRSGRYVCAYSRRPAKPEPVG
jgi:hypothetical protein